MVEKIQRRVAGYHDIRMDGLTDLVCRARGMSVMDIGCNRGLVAFEFANNGASSVAGVDNYADGIRTAKELFIDLRNVESRFEVVDLSRGKDAMVGFGRYDITVMLATYHKIKRVMSPELLTGLVSHLGRNTGKYFAWRGTSDKHDENLAEMDNLDRDLGLKRIHTSMISKELGIAAIWERL